MRGARFAVILDDIWAKFAFWGGLAGAFWGQLCRDSRRYWAKIAFWGGLAGAFLGRGTQKTTYSSFFY